MSWFLLSMMKALFSWSLLLVLLPFGLEISDASESQFQILDMSPYHSSPMGSFCQRSSKTGLSFDNRLEVVHKHGPCAHKNNGKRSKLSSAKILENDQQRVKSIQAQVAPSINTNKDPNKLSTWDEKDKLPIRADGNYIVTIGLGSPERRLSLIFDTGSDITWTQCQPCTKGCYKQNDKIFDPRRSKTYSNISCNSKDCPHDPNFGCYRNVTCLYGVRYGDGSYTVGFLGKEKLTVTPTHVFPHYLFGCGIENDGVFTHNVDGILGLSRDPISFVSQTAQNYGEYFSYCLPRNLHSTGFLAFGKPTKKDHDNAKIVSTPFVRGSYHNYTSFYFIEIIAITVGGTRLAINVSVFKKAGAVIDSGTVITRLPPAAYNATSKEFKKQMNKNKYKSAPAYSILDTCFYISGNTNKAKIPTVSFTFKGNATLDLDASGTLWVVNSTYVCLAFIGNSRPDSLAIFGNTQQKKYEVAYDVAGMKLGFSYNPYCN